MKKLIMTVLVIGTLTATTASAKNYNYNLRCDGLNDYGTVPAGTTQCDGVELKQCNGNTGKWQHIWLPSGSIRCIREEARNNPDKRYNR